MVELGLGQLLGNTRLLTGASPGGQHPLLRLLVRKFQNQRFDLIHLRCELGRLDVRFPIVVEKEANLSFALRDARALCDVSSHQFGSFPDYGDPAMDASQS